MHWTYGAPRIFLAGLIVALAVLVLVARASAAPVAFSLIRHYDFEAGPDADWTGTICDWVNYGGDGNSSSLLMVGGDACLAGPYEKAEIYQVQVLWQGYFLDDNPGEYRVVILNEQYQLVQQSGLIAVSGGYSTQFPSSTGIDRFYVLFEHVSGVAVHLDEVQIGWATQPPTPTPEPTPTPGATSTPAPTPTAEPTPTPTPTPEPYEDVDNKYACGGRGWFNWLLCWIVPPPDTFASLQNLWDFLFGKDPFVTVKRLADIRSAMVAAVNSGGEPEDISTWPAMIQWGFVFLFYDVMGQYRLVIQALFDATAAILLWKYVTLRVTT